MEQVKVLILTNQQILVSQLDEVATMDIGDPNCKMIETFLNDSNDPSLLTLKDQYRNIKKIYGPIRNGNTAKDQSIN